MDDGFGVIFKKIYSGDCIEYNIKNLTPSIAYSLYVTANNFNGEGQKS